MRGEPDIDDRELSVVIPTRDRPDLFPRAAASVLRQGVSGVTVVVVDDGSDPPAVLGATDSLVHLHRIEPAGASAARNAGVSVLPQTRWVAFLDSDDEVADGWVAFMLDTLRDGASLATCAADYHWSDGSRETPVPVQMWRSADAPRALFLAGTFAVERELFEKVGGYRVGLRFGENTDLGLRLGAVIRSEGLRVAATDRPLLRVNAVRKPFDAAVRFESAVMQLEPADPALVADRRLHASYLAIAGVAASRVGRRSTAVRYLAQAVRTDPLQWRHSVRLLRSLVKPRRT